MKKHEIKRSRGSHDPQSVQYGHSVQYGLGLLHGPLGYGPPIALTLTFRIYHEIKTGTPLPEFVVRSALFSQVGPKLI